MKKKFFVVTDARVPATSEQVTRLANEVENFLAGDETVCGLPPGVTVVEVEADAVFLAAGGVPPMINKEAARMSRASQLGLGIAG